MALTNDQVIEAEDAVVLFRSSRARQFEKKVIKRIGDKTIEEAKIEAEAQKEQGQAQLQEMIASEKEMAAQAEESMTAFNQVQEEVSAKMHEEIAGAVKYCELKAAKNSHMMSIDALRGELFEAMKKVAMLEVLSVNRQKAKVLQEQAQVAAAAASEANKQIAEEKKLHKEKLEATRRAWATMDKKGDKRVRAAVCDADDEEPSSKHQTLDSKQTVVSEADIEEPSSERPTSDGNQIPSPAVSQSSPKPEACEAEELGDCD